jgi:hypothetical protein
VGATPGPAVAAKADPGISAEEISTATASANTADTEDRADNDDRADIDDIAAMRLRRLRIPPLTPSP